MKSPMLDYEKLQRSLSKNGLIKTAGAKSDAFQKTVQGKSVKSIAGATGKTYSIAAYKPGNIEVVAKSPEEALQKAQNGEGYWQEDTDADIKIVGTLVNGGIVEL